MTAGWTRSAVVKGVIRYRAGFKYQLTAPYAIQLETIRPKPGTATPAPLMSGSGRFLPRRGLGQDLVPPVHLTTGGLLTIAAGYAWDGASGPTRDTKNSMRASLVHDALYQLGRMGVIARDQRVPADLLFKAICREDGMWRARAFLWWRAVVRFAGGAFTKNGRPVLTAP